MKHIRIHKPRMAREHPWDEVLPADPRDPDVVRVKILARTTDSRRPTAATSAVGKDGRADYVRPLLRQTAPVRLPTGDPVTSQPANDRQRRRKGRHQMTTAQE